MLHTRSLLFAALLVTGCANGRAAFPAADTDLALRRVVLYRNGIGYFERHGDVDGDALAVKVRRDQVDDLLKSLTVIDRSTGKAVSVSMPLDPESWASAALSTLAPGRGSLAEVLDGLRGTEVVLMTDVGHIRGRIVMVERIVNEPDPHARGWHGASVPEGMSQNDFKVTLLDGKHMDTVRLSKVHGVTLRDGDLALQLNRRLDASAGEGMFQQVEVVIRLAGRKAHDLAVSYVVAAPMWKPTYRVVLPEAGKGKALLQGWAVVDNTSGEDWNDVSLSLTSGEPIAFRYDLHTPRTVGRADLTEAGVSRRATVAVGETSYDDTPMPAPDVASAPAGAAEPAKTEEEYAGYDKDMRADDGVADRKRMSKGSGSGAGRGYAGDESKPDNNAPTTPAAQPIDYESLRRSTLASARSKQVAGLTSFDLRERVTVPNGSSTMVAVLNQEVQGEQTFLYRPGGAGIGYEANPYRVVRFRNSTPFVLEPGPISIYSGDSFVGEGLSESVGAGMSATLPFAVEPGIMVTSVSDYSGESMQLLRIVRGVLEVESFARTTTKWTVKAPQSMGVYTVLVRHPKSGMNYELQEKPAGTETLPDAYLVPVSVKKPGDAAEVTLIEQTPSTTQISIWDGRAQGLLEGLLAAGTLTADLRKKLEPIVKLRQEVGRIDTEIDGLKRQQVELDQRANETRENLEAIKKDPAAGSLRSKLNARLDDFTKDGDKIGRKVVELNSQRLDKKIQLEDMLQNLEIEAPKKKGK